MQVIEIFHVNEQLFLQRFVQCIQSRSITHSGSNYPHDALHIWAENKPVDEYNATRLNQIPAQQYTLTAIDQYPQHVSK